MSIFHIFSFFLQSAISATSVHNQLLFRNMGLSQSAVGLLLSVGQTSAMVMPLVVGLVSDKTGKDRIILILSGILSVLFMIPVIKSSSIVLIAISYFIGFGFVNCFNPLADGYLNKSLGNKTEKYGIIRACGTFGYMCCLLFTAFVGFPNEKSNSQIFLNMCIFVGIMVLITVLSPKDLDVYSQNQEKRERFSLKCFDKTFYMFMFIIFVSYIAMASVDRLLASYLTETFNLGTKYTAVIAVSTLSEIFMFIIGDRLTKKGIGNSWVYLLLMTIGLFLRLTLYWTAPVLWVFILAQLLHSLCFGSMHLGFTSFVNKTVPKRHISSAMAIYWAVAFGFAELIGTMAGGFIIDACGYRFLFAIYSIFPVLGFIFCFVFRKSITSKIK